MSQVQVCRSKVDVEEEGWWVGEDVGTGCGGFRDELKDEGTGLLLTGLFGVDLVG